ncbi:MAG: hypothetical protein ABMA26_05220 [Limisphaerales bacterium]
MPQQLIYTSAPQGVDVGRSGYCTVARSSTMGESLVQRLEQFSYYERLSEHGGEAERTVFIFRNIDIRGKAYHVLSRIKDAPADYTGRTNFIAQHLVFTPDEVAKMPTPAVILRRWSGWKDHWEQEPRLFESESWGELDELQKRTFLPAKLWYRETGDYGRAASFIGLNSGAFAAQDFSPATILDLLSEALELLQLEGPNWRALAWQRTFSVGCQPQDNSADFRWRFLTSGLQFELAVTQGRTPQELRTLRAVSHSRQVQFATEGPVTPHFTLLPKAGEAVQRNEGETLILECAAESLPGKITYRWYSVGKDNTTGEELNEAYGAHTGKLTIPKIGRGKHRYKVIAWDSVTAAAIESHVIVVEVKERLSLSGRPLTSSPAVSPLRQAARVPKPLHVERNPEPTVQAREYTPSYDLEPDIPLSFLSRHSNKVFVIGVAFLLIVCAGFFLRTSERGKSLLTTFQKALKQLTPSAAPTSQPLVDANEPVKPNSKTHIEVQNPAGKPSKGSGNNVTHPLHAILAESDWSKLLKPITDELRRVEQNAHNAAEALKAAGIKQNQAKIEAEKNKGESKKSTSDFAELKKANDHQAKTEKDLKSEQNQLESLKQKHKLLLNRQISANQIQFPNKWPYFPTNINLRVRWSELGILTENPNPVSVEWRTNYWNFKTDNWSLQISQSGAVYQPTKPSSAIRVSIASEENAGETNQLLQLLLFSASISNRFSTTLVGDDLKPNAELQELLSSLALANNNALRVMASHPSAKNPMSNTLTEINVMNSRNEPWKLGIKAQLTADAEEAAILKQVKNAFARVDTFWIKVAEESKLALREEDFSTAIDPFSNLKDGYLRKAFWEKLDLLCLVSIYKRELLTKAPKLEEKDNVGAKKILSAYMESADDGGSKFKEELMQLTDDLRHFQYFWKTVYEKKIGKDGKSSLFKGKSYKDIKSNLAQLIEELERHGGTIEPANLRITLEFQAFGNSWIPITRLNARIP